MAIVCAGRFVIQLTSLLMTLLVASGNWQPVNWMYDETVRGKVGQFLGCFSFDMSGDWSSDVSTTYLEGPNTNQRCVESCRETAFPIAMTGGSNGDTCKCSFSTKPWPVKQVAVPEDANATGPAGLCFNVCRGVREARWKVLNDAMRDGTPWEQVRANFTAPSMYACTGEECCGGPEGVFSVFAVGQVDWARRTAARLRPAVADIYKYGDFKAQKNVMIETITRIVNSQGEATGRLQCWTHNNTEVYHDMKPSTCQFSGHCDAHWMELYLEARTWEFEVVIKREKVPVAETQVVHNTTQVVPGTVISNITYTTDSGIINFAYNFGPTFMESFWAAQGNISHAVKEQLARRMLTAGFFRNGKVSFDSDSEETRGAEIPSLGHDVYVI
jgi:hypothetical protein